MSHSKRDELQVWMPGAFARTGPVLAGEFTAATGQTIAFAPFKPSGILAAGILAGQSADVYVSANVQWMRRLQRARLLRHWATLARNRLCLITLPDVCVNRLRDLTHPGLRVVAPQAATDPCGRYVELAWRDAGILAAMRGKEAAGELIRSVGSGDLPAFLQDARAEVGILYVSEARQLDATRVRTVELRPHEDLHDRIRFVVGALTERGLPFARWLLGPPRRPACVQPDSLPPANQNDAEGEQR